MKTCNILGIFYLTSKLQHTPNCVGVRRQSDVKDNEKK